MPFTVEYDSDCDYMLSTITGQLDKKIIGEIFTEIGIIAAENECERILCDLRDAVLVASTHDIYNSLNVLENNQISRNLKRALVISRNSKDYGFWETVCVNRGYVRIKIYHDYDEAALWLAQS